MALIPDKDGKRYTYSLLGVGSTLNEDLNHIAWTVALAIENKCLPIFPRWNYEQYFSIPDVYFTPKIPEGSFDVAAPTPGVRTVGWIGEEPVIRAIFRPQPKVYTALEEKYGTDSIKKYTAVHLVGSMVGSYFDEYLEYEIFNEPKMIFTDNIAKWKDEPYINNAQFIEYDPTNELDSVLTLFRMAQCGEHVGDARSLIYWAHFLGSSRGFNHV